MPGINSTDPSLGQIYQHYFHIDSYDCSGHCSQMDSYCRDLGVCDSSYAGLLCDNSFTQDACNNSINPMWSWQSPYRDYKTCVENGFDWTAYDIQNTCEYYGGIWVGNESGSQGNDAYDIGENFIDTEKHLILKAVHPSPLSAHKGFLGNSHFSKCNEYLSEKEIEPIDWSI